MKVQVPAKQYWSSGYNSKERFYSYWNQIEEIMALRPEKVLEIGIGSGFLSRYLKERNIAVTGLDFDENLHPDVVGSVLEIPFPDNTFDVVACFEVLEHLPFEKFTVGLSEILRVSKKHAVISVPEVSKIMRLSLQISRIQIKKIIPLPYPKEQHVFDGEHYWEIGKAGYSLVRILDEVRKSGCAIEKTFRPFESPYNRFLVLKK